MSGNTLFGLVGKTLSTEAIKPIHNSVMINDLIDQFTEIQSIIEFKKMSNPMTPFKDKDISKVFKNITKTIKNGMGIEIKHVYAETIYAVVPITFDKNYAINEDSKYVIEHMREQVKSCEVSGWCDTNLDSESINALTTHTEVSSMLDKTLKNMELLQKEMSTKELVIDFDNAFIRNFNQNDPVFVMTDFVFLFRTMKLSPRNVVAILMHEMGHVFTHISESYRDVVQTTLLMESLRDTIDGNSNDKVLKLLMESEDIDTNEFESNPNSAVVKLITNKLKVANNNSVLAYTDSEQMADQFSTRFGLGKDLVEGLHKIGEYFRSYVISINDIPLSLKIYVFYLIMVIGPIAAGVLIATAIAMTYTIHILISTIGGSSDSRRTTYDKDFDRFRRVKEDIIRQLRTTDIPKKYKSKMISDIDYITSVMNQVEDDPLFERIGNFMPWNINDFRSSEIQRLIESVSENDVHTSKHKLEKLLY